MFKSQVFKTWALVLQLGISMLVPIFLLTAVGYYIKKRFNFDFILIFILFGVLVGIRNVYVIVINYLHSIENEQNSKSELIKKHLKNINGTSKKP